MAGAIHSLTLILLTIHRVTDLVNDVEGGGGGDPLPNLNTINPYTVLQTLSMMWRAVAGAIHSLTLILLTVHCVTDLVNDVEGGGGGDPLPNLNTINCTLCYRPCR